MTPRELHNKAMEILLDAQKAKSSGDLPLHQQLLKKAFALEKDAANGLYNKIEAEPTRSILYKGAATLAVNCGDFREAEKLIFSALSGSPPKEIEEELKHILSQINESSVVILEEDEKDDFILLNVLRDRSIDIKIEPKTLKYGKEIVLAEDIIAFLSSIKSSFINYTRTNFLRSFNESDFTSDFEKVVNSVIAECKLLFVNLKFGSFAASISSDVIMNSNLFSPKLNEWRLELFEKYKAEVFHLDYNSEAAIQEVVNKYSDNERRRIYGGMINALKESSNYRVSLTDKHFNVVKSLPAISTSVKKKFLSGSTREENIPKILVETISFLPANKTGGIPRSSIISNRALDSASFTVPMKDIVYNEMHLVLVDDIEIKINYEVGIFSIDFTDFNISVFASTPDDVVTEFSRQFISLYGSLLADVNLHSSEQKRLKEKFDLIVFSRNW